MTISMICGKYKLKPPLKWAGGKRWLMPYLLPLWEKQSSLRLVEPFCGGLAVSLGLMPDNALLNDYNKHLINFFNQVKQGLVVNMPMVNEEEFYYKYRNLFNGLLKDGKALTTEAAQLFYYLNRTGYNGLCRFNKKGYFNVPFGRYKKINYISDFRIYMEVFKNWSFMSFDFEELALNENDFIYADPPYDVQFTAYADRDFTWNDQVRLAKWLAAHGGPVILSNQATDRIVDLYSSLGYHLTYLDAPRRISCTGDRTPAKEVLAIRNCN